MSKITVWFIKSAMLYFVLAIVVGLHMAASGTTYPYMPIHAHLNLLGWISMMIYGVGYHILPRFSGRPLYSDRLAEWQFWLAKIGPGGMFPGWGFKNWGGRQNNAYHILHCRGYSSCHICHKHAQNNKGCHTSACGKIKPAIRQGMY